MNVFQISNPRWYAPLVLAAFFVCLPAQAQTQHAVVNVGALSGRGTFYAEFTLTDGSATGDGNSRVVISGFTVTQGSLGSVLPPTLGSVGGDLSTSALTLRDSDASTGGLADFAQGFTVTGAGGTLSFNFALSATGTDATPDGFIFNLLNSTGVPLATTGPKGYELIGADFTTLTPTPHGYVTTGAYSPAITATITPAATPEPSPSAVFALGVLGLSGLAMYAPRRRVIERN